MSVAVSIRNNFLTEGKTIRRSNYDYVAEKLDNATLAKCSCISSLMFWESIQESP